MHRTIEELLATLPSVDVSNFNMNIYVAQEIARKWFDSLPSEDRSYLRREWNKGERGALDQDSRLYDFMFLIH